MEGTVQLIVTGEMEKKALAKALEKAFPTLSFETQQLQGFTSADLSNSMLLNLPIKRIAYELVAAVDPGRPSIIFNIFAILSESKRGRNAIGKHTAGFAPLSLSIGMLY